jgi:hypothetical protein
MKNTHDDLILDPDGIPILTNLIREDTIPDAAELAQPSPNSEVSVDELTALLLNSNTFTQQLDEIAAELTRSVREQTELALRPVLEEAISLALDDSNAAACEAVSKQLRATLPGLIARTLQD